MSEVVSLVNENDEIIGKEEKMKAHEKGLLHRAFSILVFCNDKLIIQKRALSKYHCPGIWANTCCSHPHENIEEDAHKRLQFEMGFDCELKEEFSFIYKTEFDNGLTEYEYDHVFIGEYCGEINPNPDEVAEFKYITIQELKKEIEKNPNEYASWFKIIIDKLKK